MNNVPFTVEEIKRQAGLHRDEPPSDRSQLNFRVLVDKDGKATKFAIKISMQLVGSTTLRTELSIMNHLSNTIKSNMFVTPKGYGWIQDGKWELLVMEFLEGETIWEIMKEGQRSLSDKDADDIAAAYEELRKLSPPDSDKLTPAGGWVPRGFLFPYDGDGGRYLKDRKDFEDFMHLRLEKAGINPKDLPLGPYVFTIGDISPYNIKRLPDGRLGFFGWDMSAWLPKWWEHSGIQLSLYGWNKFNEPLLHAFERRSLVVGESLSANIFKLHCGLARWGRSVVNQEIKAGKPYFKFEVEVPEPQ